MRVDLFLFKEFRDILQRVFGYLSYELIYVKAIISIIVKQNQQRLLHVFAKC
jgi:hypothetical protein